MALYQGRLREKPLAGSVFMAACLAVCVCLPLAVYLIASPWLAPKPQVFFPYKENIQTPSAKMQSGINLNTATREELMTLPGIGEITADAIVLFRGEQGPFYYIEDLLAVKGIGVKKIEAFKGLLYIGDTQ